MSDPVLKVENLSVLFAKKSGFKPVVNNISFDIAKGETLALVGESGSGKSVSAMSIMRLLNPASSRLEGSISFQGRNLLAVSEQEMQKIRGAEISMIFQEPMTSLNPVRTIGYQICEPLMQHRGMSHSAARAEAIELLERVHIPGAKTRLDQYPLNFSGGMRQRVMIAMALACRPKLLIADEPTTALDVTIQAQILNLISEIQQDLGTSVLFITHDLGVVAKVAERTMVMCAGEHIETQSTKDVFRRPGHSYTKALLAAMPRLGEMRDTTTPRPFPVVDRETGAQNQPENLPDTVAKGDTAALELRNLVLRYPLGGGFLRPSRGAVHAVENVSFRVQPGETLGLVGESGCGKSTIGRTVMGLNTVTSGDILVKGRTVTRYSDKERNAMFRDIQMVFQDPYSSLNPRKTIGTAIATPMRVNNVLPKAEIDRRVCELMKQVGLTPEMRHRYPQEFSGGQRQRICIARSLALNPSILIADEAVSALDVSIQAQIINLMLDLQQKLNLAYLFISHDMAVIERVSHRVAVMHLGEIVEIGPRDAVLNNPQHAYTNRLLASVPVPDPELRSRTQPPEVREISNAIRPPGYEPEKRHYREVSDGHYVMSSPV